MGRGRGAAHDENDSRIHAQTHMHVHESTFKCTHKYAAPYIYMPPGFTWAARACHIDVLTSFVLSAHHFSPATTHTPPTFVPTESGTLAASETKSTPLFCLSNLVYC